MLASITSEMADIVRPRAWNASQRQSREPTAAVPSHLFPYLDMLFFNTLEAGEIPSCRASFRPVAGRLGPNLGPSIGSVCRQRQADLSGPARLQVTQQPFKALLIFGWLLPLPEIADVALIA
jgi:hypothetical protein